MRTWSRCGGRGIPFFLKALLLDGKTVCGACKQAVYLCFFGLCRNAQSLADGTFCGGPFWGLQSIKFLDASQFRLCLLYGNGMGRLGYRALQRVSSVFLCKKGLLYMGFAQYSSPFYLLSHCTCQSAGNRRGSCWFSLRPSREKSSSAKPTGLTELQKLKSVVTPALLAAPARSRCSGICR